MQTVITKSKNELTITLNGNTVTTSNLIMAGNFAGKTAIHSTKYDTERKALNAYKKLVELNS